METIIQSLVKNSYKISSKGLSKLNNIYLNFVTNGVTWCYKTAQDPNLTYPPYYVCFSVHQILMLDRFQI